MTLFAILTIVFGVFLVRANGANNSFYAYYSYLWGSDHFSVNPQGTEAQLKFDNYSGAGFRSKLEYGYGLFQIKLKLPKNKTGGVVTSFYLTSLPDNHDPENHIEINYEFLGTNGTVRTNIYDNDMGHRYQTFNLWFDPSTDFHTYAFLWNPYQIVFTIDNIPIRVFKNYTSQGLTYLTKPMHIEATIWKADWAGEVDWTLAPFITYFSGFGFDACPAQGNDDISECGSDRYYWNGTRYRQLNDAERQQMAYYRSKYMIYDYCHEPSTRKDECSLND